MLGVIIAAIVTAWIAYLVFKNYKPQPVIFMGGMILLACAIMMGKPIIAAKQSLGFAWFDIFKVMEDIMSNRVAGLGLMIMSVAGFVRYMDHIGASKAFVNMGVKPLKIIRSPYVVLALGYIIGQMMKMAITSAAGLGALLMATMFPLLTDLGASRPAAAAAIVTASCIDLGPAAATSNLVAKNANIEPVIYFIQYQLPIAIPVIIAVALLHYVVQQWLDKKAGHEAVRTEIAATETESDGNNPPLFYAFLPILPLILIFIFNPVVGSKVKMSLISAMFIGLVLSMLCELIRYRDAKTVLKSIQSFFDGMGKSFATVVSLVIAGETFAKGLSSVGAIDTIIKGTQGAGFSGEAMILVMQTVIAASALVTGSGDASMFSFAGLVPVMAEHLAINPAHMLLPMQFAGTIARAASPISGVVVTVAGLAMISPVEVVKRTAIPMAGALIITTIMNFIWF